MDKQKVTTTSSMNRKGYSSSSHYRINPTAEKSEQVLAIKFVQWDVLPLESLCNSSLLVDIIIFTSPISVPVLLIFPYSLVSLTSQC